MSEQQETRDTIEIEPMMAGAELVRVGELQLAVGFPEEVVKSWLRADRQASAWLVPDVRCSDGVVQWALEFPLYYALFVQGMLARGAQMPVVVRREDWPDVVEYLRLTLLGLDREALLREGVEPATAEALLREGAHLALKHADGRVVQIEDVLEPHFFDDEGVVDLGPLRIKRHGDNTYSFFTATDRVEEHRLAPAGPEAAPYAAALDRPAAPVLPQPFEIIALGTSTGFDPAGPCSNLVVQASGRFVVVDSGPYVRQTLRAAGIHPGQLSAVVLTHCHEDHAVGLASLIDVPARLKLFATRENAAIMRRKLAILHPGVANPATLLDDAFDVVCISPGATLDYLGLKLRFHYTMHSIPCTGVELSMRDSSGERRALIIGDNDAREHIEQAAALGVLSEERLARLRALYRWEGDLVVADTGGGMIHGVPADFAASPAATVVCVHAAALPEEARGRFTLAEPGHRYTLIPENGRPSPLERALAYRALRVAFPGVDQDELSAMLDAAAAVSVNRGHVVLREGDESDDLFIALSGELAVHVGQPPAARCVATLGAGEIFGEMAVVTGGRRSASVQARTACRLVRISGEAFRRLVHVSDLAPTLPPLWRKRADLERAAIFGRASVTVKNALARESVRRRLDPGVTLIREGSASTTVFVLVAGRAQVYRGSEPLLVGGAPVILDPGSVLGETAPFLRQARNASIVTLDHCEVLAIRGGDFERIVRGSPQLHHGIAQVVGQRQAA